MENAYKRARLLIDKEKEKQKEQYDRNIKDMKINVGDLVLVRNEVGHKLDNRYLGPFMVKEILENNNSILEDKIKNKTLKINKNRLKLFVK